MYIEDLITRREFQARWISVNRTVVDEYIIANGERKLVGTVFVGRGAHAERDCNQYIGSRIGGLTLINGTVVDRKLANLYQACEDCINQIEVKA